MNQRGFGIMHLVLILFIGALTTITLQKYWKKAEEERVRTEKLERLGKVEEQLNSVVQVAEEFIDAVQLASATSRIALSGPVQRMRDIHQNMKKLDVSGCAANSRSIFDQYMTLVEQGFISFMRGSDAMNIAVSESMFEDAKAKRVEFVESAKECRKLIQEEWGRP